MTQTMEMEESPWKVKNLLMNSSFMFKPQNPVQPLKIVPV